VASKLVHDSAKSRAKGLSGNRSAENILHQLEESSDASPRTDPAPETPVEVSFEIRKKYDIKDFNYFCIENEKRSIRRAKSNDSLLMQRRIVVRQPTRAAAQQTPDKSQTLPQGLSGSREILNEYASSGDVTTSDDGRSGSCASFVLESEL